MIGFGTRYERGTGREEARGNFVTHASIQLYPPAIHKYTRSRRDVLLQPLPATRRRAHNTIAELTDLLRVCPDLCVWLWGPTLVVSRPAPPFLLC